MALDSYSLCPGGRNKKIRFCCPDKLKELEQIGTMLADQQYKACVTMIEELEKKHTDCACLTAAKLTALRSQSLWEEFKTIAEEFYAREPQNGTAISELAIARAVFGETAEAISLLVDGYELPEEGKALSAVVMATQMISQIFCQTGSPICGLALAKLLPACMPQSEEISMFLRELISETNLPAPLKGLRFNPFAPNDFPGKAEYDTVAPLIATGRWKTAMKKLDALVEQAEQWPGVLMSQALLQLWLNRNTDAFATLRKYAQMPGVAEEDQADAMAIVYMTDRRNLGDDTSVVHWETTVNDFERAQERMLSEPRLYSVEFDPQRYGSAENPAPRNIFMVLDRPFATDDAPPTIENVPQQIGTAFLYGKQTDREARIEIIETLDANREQVMTILSDTLQEAMGESNEPQPSRETSIILAHIDGRLRFRNANPPTREQVEQITRDYISENGPFQNWWFNQPFSELDGKTPLEAASETQYRPRLLGMITMIEFLFPARYALEATNAMRKKLGFAELGEIALPSENADLVLSQMPTTRWFRADTSSIPNESLAGELAMLDLISDERGSLHFAGAVLERPLTEIDSQIRALAFRVLIDNAEDLEDFETAVLWIDRARNEAKELGQSLGEWDVAELMVRIKERNQPVAMRLINHIMTNYKHDQRVMAAMQSLFMQMGLLNPDGTPTAFARQQPRQRPTATGPMSDAAGMPDQDSPFGQTPEPPGNSENSGGSKLWVPD